MTFEFKSAIYCILYGNLSPLGQENSLFDRRKHRSWSQITTRVRVFCLPIRLVYYPFINERNWTPTVGA